MVSRIGGASAWRTAFMALLIAVVAAGCKTSEETLTARFAGNGSGTITFSSANAVLPAHHFASNSGGTYVVSHDGVSCIAACSASFQSGVSVTLTAAPAADSTFTGWSGDCSGPVASVYVTVNAAKSCTATFALKTFVLTVQKSGSGGGSMTSSPAGIDCGSTCAASFDSGQTVTLTVVADANSIFTGWSGDCSGTDAAANVAMTAYRRCTATFQPGTMVLTVGKTGAGNGALTSNPAGIDCGAGCSSDSQAFPTGSTISLSAEPDANSLFEGWSGNCSGTDPAISVTLSQVTACTASFILRDVAGSMVIATSEISESDGSRLGTRLSLARFTAGGDVFSYTAGQLIIPLTPPAFTRCGGDSFENYGRDQAFGLLFIAFHPGAGQSVVCAYAVDPVRGNIAFAFAAPAGAGPAVIDAVNHVVVFPSGVSYSYTQLGLNALPVSFAVATPGGSTVQAFDFVNGLIWYGTTGGDGSHTLEGACRYTYTAGSGYANAGACTPFASAATPYRTALGLDSSAGLFFAETTDALCPAGAAATVVRMFSYDVSTGIFSDPLDASTSLGVCDQVVRNPNQGDGDADTADALLFGLSTAAGRTITPLPYTASPPAFAAPLGSQTVNGGVGSTAIDPISHLLFTLTAQSGDITGVTVYPYDTAGLGTAVTSQLKLAQPTPVPCPTSCVEPLFAITH